MVTDTGHDKPAITPGHGRPLTLLDAYMQEGRDFLNVPETAEIFGVDQRTIRRYITEGTIPAVKIGEHRVPVRWLAEQARAVAA